MLQIYFAHPVPLPFEKKRRPRWAIEHRWEGAHIIDPEEGEHQVQYAESGMDYFLEAVIPTCDLVVAMHYSDLSWGSGVWAELQQALRLGKETYRVDALGMIQPYTPIIQKPFTLLTVKETQQRRHNM